MFWTQAMLLFGVSSPSTFLPFQQRLRKHSSSSSSSSGGGGSNNHNSSISISIIRS